MGDPSSDNGLHAPPPFALFVGDFNSGKSSIVNALLRRDALPESREESRALPAFITRSERKEAAFAAWLPEQGVLHPKTHEEFRAIRRDRDNAEGYAALTARFPNTPFQELVLTDSAGFGGESLEAFDMTALAQHERALAVVVTDIEYWSAKHTMDFIAEHHALFAGAMLVAANKADHLNASEIRRLRDKAAERMERYGIRPAPAFIPLSARLERGRHDPFNEYRQRTKREVREQCDAGFDALRVALYEFETSRQQSGPALAFDHLLRTPIAESFVALQGTVPA